MLGAVPPRDRLQEVLRDLARIREDPSPPASQTELRRVLARESSQAVARAAALAGECGGPLHVRMREAAAGRPALAEAVERNLSASGVVVPE
jgi:hypothetical protein